MDGMITAKDVESFVPVGVPAAAAAAVPLSVPSTAAPQTAPGQPAFRTSGKEHRNIQFRFEIFLSVENNLEFSVNRRIKKPGLVL